MVHFICVQVRKQSSLKCKVESLPHYLMLVMKAVLSLLVINTACSIVMFLSWNLGTLGRFFLSFNKNNLYVFLMYLWNIHEQRRALRDVDHLNI